jgi:hypothetical protein
MQRKKRTFTNTREWARFKGCEAGKGAGEHDMDDFVRAFQRLSLSD